MSALCRTYTVGWVCALPIELAAARRMLDEIHEDSYRSANDTNIYTLGRIGQHNVVVACLPYGQIGTNSAAAVAARMTSTFPHIEFGLMVGIGGGVPSQNRDIRLGDVVVSRPSPSHGGVVQYDFGKTTESGFQRTGFLNAPPILLLSAIAKLEANRGHAKAGFLKHLSNLNLPEFSQEAAGPDLLFEASYHHVNGETCANCDHSKVIQRKPRDQNSTVHYGTIASGNQVMKDALQRDRVSSELGDVLCFEMEAAGLMNTFQCLVIRGICGYADSHKNKRWQPYAAGTAAAYAKEVLCVLPLANNEANKNGQPTSIALHSSFGAWLESFRPEPSLMQYSHLPNKHVVEAVQFKEEENIPTSNDLIIPTLPGDTKVLLRVSLQKSGVNMAKTYTISAGLRTRVDEVIDLLQEHGVSDIQGFFCEETNTSCGPCIHQSAPERVWVTNDQSCYSIDDGLAINIDEALQSFNDYLTFKPLNVTIHDSGLRVNGGWEETRLDVRFIRTLRVPDDGNICSLPAGFGPFPLFSTTKFQDKLPPDIAQKGGIFFPILQREALLMSFTGSPSFAIRVRVGGVNAITGNDWETDNDSNQQTYIVAPEQKWLDGIRTSETTVRQFVAMPIGSGYSVEHQVTGKEDIAGIQMEFIPRRPIPREVPDLYRVEICSNSSIPSVSRPIDIAKSPKELGLHSGAVISFHYASRFPPYKVYRDARRFKDLSIHPDYTHSRASVIRDFLTDSVTLDYGINLQAIQQPTKILTLVEFSGRSIRMRSYNFVFTLSAKASPFSDFHQVLNGIRSLINDEVRKHGFSCRVHFKSISIQNTSARKTAGNLFDRDSNTAGTLFDLGYGDKLNLEISVENLGIFYHDRHKASCFCSHNHGEALLYDDPIYSSINEDLKPCYDGEGLEPCYDGGAKLHLNSDSRAFQPAAVSSLKWDMGIAAGGRISQKIYKDSDPSLWEWQEARLVNIQMLNSVAFKAVTGFDPPASPITTEDYVAQGTPMYVYDVESTLTVESTMERIHSVAAIDLVRGTKVNIWGNLSKPTICWSCQKKMSTVIHSSCYTCFNKMKMSGAKCSRCCQKFYSVTELSASMGIAEEEARQGTAIQSVEVFKLGRGTRYQRDPSLMSPIRTTDDGHKTAVEWLPDMDVSPRHLRGSTISHCFAWPLLPADGRRQTMLSKAVFNGHEAAADMLLCLNIVGGNREAWFSWASENGHEALLNLLLDMNQHRV